MTQAVKVNEAVAETPSRKKIGPITYPKIFWLFIFGSLIGVPLEGFWELIRYGSWETHVVTIWGPFCIIYGFGAVGCYIGAVLLQNKNIFIRFFAFALIGAGVEFICGWVLEYGLHMRAWDYSNASWNLKGYVTLNMTLLWGALGVGFGFFVPFIEKVFDKMRGKAWRVVCVCMSCFMAVNFAVTTVCFIRWKDRHEGVAPQNRLERWIDETYGDELMEKRFCEWFFIDEKING